METKIYIFDEHPQEIVKRIAEALKRHVKAADEKFDFEWAGDCFEAFKEVADAYYQISEIQVQRAAA